MALENRCVRQNRGAGDKHASNIEENHITICASATSNVYNLLPYGACVQNKSASKITVHRVGTSSLPLTLLLCFGPMSSTAAQHKVQGT